MAEEKLQKSNETTRHHDFVLLLIICVIVSFCIISCYFENMKNAGAYLSLNNIK